MTQLNVGDTVGRHDDLVTIHDKPVRTDPGKELYAEFGVGTMRYTGALKPRTWRAALRGLANAPSLRGIGSKGRSAMGLPADFLIGTDGTVLAANHGKYTDDHWPVDELLALARGKRTSS